MKIGFWGAGKMAEGILGAMPTRKGVILSSIECNRNKEIAKKCQLIFLAVRPQDVSVLAVEVKGLITKDHTIVSIVAGKKISVLRKAFGREAGIIRVMPNLALRAGAGMCAICPDRGVNQEHLKKVEAILSNAGATISLAERHFDAVTALSGSGPAYFAYMEEAMAEAGVKLGLKKDVARLLAEQTMYGTAKFLRQSAMDLGAFISGVCTKGGTTAAGMTKLSNPLFKEIVADTLKAAAERSKFLSKA